MRKLSTPYNSIKEKVQCFGWASLFLIMGCGKNPTTVSPSPPANAAQPVFLSATAVSNSLQYGDSTTLSWTITHTHKVTVADGTGAIVYTGDSVGQYKTPRLANSGTYTLTAWATDLTSSALKILSITVGANQMPAWICHPVGFKCITDYYVTISTGSTQYFTPSCDLEVFYSNLKEEKFYCTGGSLPNISWGLQDWNTKLQWHGVLFDFENISDTTFKSTTLVQQVGTGLWQQHIQIWKKQ